MAGTLLDSPRISSTDARFRTLTATLSTAYPVRGEAKVILRGVLEERRIDLDGPAVEFWPNILRRIVSSGNLRTFLDHVLQDVSIRAHWPDIAHTRGELDVPERPPNERVSPYRSSSEDSILAPVIRLRSAFDQVVVFALAELRRLDQTSSSYELAAVSRVQRVLPDLIRELELVANPQPGGWSLSPGARNSAGNARRLCVELQGRLRDRARDLARAHRRGPTVSLNESGSLSALAWRATSTVESLVLQMQESASASAC